MRVFQRFFGGLGGIVGFSRVVCGFLYGLGERTESEDEGGRF